MHNSHELNCGLWEIIDLIEMYKSWHKKKKKIFLWPGLNQVPWGLKLTALPTELSRGKEFGQKKIRNDWYLETEKNVEK